MSHETNWYISAALCGSLRSLRETAPLTQSTPRYAEGRREKAVDFDTRHSTYLWLGSFFRLRRKIVKRIVSAQRSRSSHHLRDNPAASSEKKVNRL